MQFSDFSSRLPYPCHLEHDSKAAADLELWNHPQLDSALVFLLNPNLGGAIITGHEVHQGNHMRSGLIEHICIDPDGPKCYCGNHGCLETYCSANALKVTAGMPIKDFFNLLHQTQAPNLIQIWRNYLDHLAFAIRNLNLVIDSPVIISGYLAPYFLDADMQYLLNKVNEGSLFQMTEDQLLVGNHRTVYSGDRRSTLLHQGVPDAGCIVIFTLTIIKRTESVMSFSHFFEKHIIHRSLSFYSIFFSLSIRCKCNTFPRSAE